MTQTIINVPAAGAFDPTDIEITDGVDDAFLIKDTTGTEWFKIDTRTGTAGNWRYSITMAPTLGQRVLIGDQNGPSSGPFSPLMVVNQNNDSYAVRIYGDYPYSSSNNQFVWGRDGVDSYWIHPLGGKFLSATSSGSFNFKNSSSTDMFVLDDDSNATFTLDDASGATFKVTDNGASPKSFFSATEGGNTFLQSDVSTFLDGGGAIYIRVGTSNRIRADGGALYLGGTGKYNIVDAGTPFYNRSTSLVDLGATTATEVVSIQSDGAYKALKCTPTTTSQTFTLEFQDGSSANGVYAIEQHFAIYNAGTENCTIQATITSGRGSALGKDLSAGGSTSGELVSGMTLNAGKSALFKAVKWNKILASSATSADNEFMFQTIMVEA